MSRQNGFNDLRDAGSRIPQLIKRYLADLQRRPVSEDRYDDPPTFFFAESTRIRHNPFAEPPASTKREG